MTHYKKEKAIKQKRKECRNNAEEFLKYAIDHPDAFRSMCRQSFEDFGESDERYAKVRFYLRRAMRAANETESPSE